MSEIYLWNVKDGPYEKMYYFELCPLDSNPNIFKVIISIEELSIMKGTRGFTFLLE